MSLLVSGFSILPALLPMFAIVESGLQERRRPFTQLLPDIKSPPIDDDVPLQHPTYSNTGRIEANINKILSCFKLLPGFIEEAEGPIRIVHPELLIILEPASPVTCLGL